MGQIAQSADGEDVVSKSVVAQLLRLVTSQVLVAKCVASFGRFANLAKAHGEAGKHDVYNHRR